MKYISLITIYFFFVANLPLDARTERNLDRTQRKTRIETKNTETQKGTMQKVVVKASPKKRELAKKVDPTIFDKMSNEELLSMAEKDYNSAINDVIKKGIFLSEEDFFKSIADEAQKPPSKWALKAQKNK